MPYGVELAGSLSEVRRTAGAVVGLLFAARGTQAITCIAVDSEPGSPWSSTGSLLLGLTLRADQTLASARRQNRAVVVPSAELPAYTQNGVRFGGHDLPPWAMVIPLFPGRSTEGLLVLLTLHPARLADATTIAEPAARLSAMLGRVLVPFQPRAAPSPPDAADVEPAVRPAAPPSADELVLLLSLPLDGLVITDRAGKVLAANALGQDALRVLQNDALDQIWHPALLGAMRAASPAAASAELEASAQDGSRRYLRTAVATAPGTEMVLFTLRDVTEERLMHERLLQSEKMASIGQLVSGVAHELNNPLTGIMGFAQLLLLRQDLPDGVQRDVTTIFEEAERASKIVQNLLSFARRRRPERERVNLNDLIERVLELRSYDLRVHNIEPRAHLSSKLKPIFADPHQIQQVLLNVIRNAEHAVRDRGGNGHITITTSEAGGTVRLLIADDGNGIAPEHLRRIFDPFFTTKPAGEGTGLGLTIVYGIIEEHGGHVSVDSEVGKGTTFRLELPIASSANHGRTPNDATPDRRPAVRHSVLVIDDEPNIREVLFVLLARDGHDVESAPDGLAALERLAERDFDVIITDVKMPGVDGIEFYNRVKAWDPSVAARIVFTTGDLVSPHTRNFIDSTGNPYLQKPFRIAEVRELVASLLAR